ncbi:MAG: purine phosphoribosyltransferase family protein [Bacteroidales bacterium]|nr:purine phosphoribosyltransferase family protein [Bacteroidales bacterium]
MFEDIIRHYPDFPKPGIDFIDVLPFLHDKEAFNAAVREIDRLATTPNLATVEARGFLFGAPLLTLSDHVRTLVPFRKKGKLPFAEGDLVRVEIEKEYGSDELFYRLSDFAACEPAGDVIEVTLFDDLLATGGTVDGIVRSLQRQTVGGRRIVVREFIFLVELPALGGRARLEPVAPVHALMRLEGVE